MPLTKAVALLFVYAAHKGGLLSLDRLHRAAFSLLFKQRRKNDFLSLVPAFMKHVFASQLSSSCINALQTAQRQGFHTAIFSSSPSFLVEPIAAQLGVGIVQSTQYQEDECGKFVSLQEVVLGEEKKTYLFHWRERLNIDQKKVYAYSDSVLDLSFLQAAAHPIAVNPDQELRRLALAQGWPII